MNWCHVGCHFCACLKSRLVNTHIIIGGRFGSFCACVFSPSSPFYLSSGGVAGRVAGGVAQGTLPKVEDKYISDHTDEVRIDVDGGGVPTIAALVATDFGDAAIVSATKDLLKTIALALALRPGLACLRGPLHERCDPSTLKAVGKVSSYQPDEVCARPKTLRCPKTSSWAQWGMPPSRERWAWTYRGVPPSRAAA